MVSESLKKHILESVTPHLEGLRKIADEMEAVSMTVFFPVEIDGVIDALAYNTKTREFEYVRVTLYTDETETTVKHERIYL